jgi:hypothetical protein
VDLAFSVENSCIQSVLALRLEDLLRIAEADTYQRQYQLVQAEKHPPLPFPFLCEDLWGIIELYFDIVLNELIPGLEHIYVQAPFFAGPNSGLADYCW